MNGNYQHRAVQPAATETFTKDGGNIMYRIAMNGSCQHRAGQPAATEASTNDGGNIIVNRIAMNGNCQHRAGQPVAIEASTKDGGNSIVNRMNGSCQHRAAQPAASEASTKDGGQVTRRWREEDIDGIVVGGRKRRQQQPLNAALGGPGPWSDPRPKETQFAALRAGAVLPTGPARVARAASRKLVARAAGKDDRRSAPSTLEVRLPPRSVPWRVNPDPSDGVTLTYAALDRDSIRPLLSSARLTLPEETSLGAMGTVGYSDASRTLVSCILFKRDALSKGIIIFDLVRLVTHAAEQRQGHATSCLRALEVLLRRNFPKDRIILRAGVPRRSKDAGAFYRSVGFYQGLPCGLSTGPLIGQSDCDAHHLVVPGLAAAVKAARQQRRVAPARGRQLPSRITPPEKASSPRPAGAAGRQDGAGVVKAARQHWRVAPARGRQLSSRRTPPGAAGRQDGAGRFIEPLLAPVTWDERLQQLRAFRAMHGHINVPYRYAANPSLGGFVARQRHQYWMAKSGKGSVDEKKVRQMNELGFRWAGFSRAAAKAEQTEPNGTGGRGVAWRMAPCPDIGDGWTQEVVARNSVTPSSSKKIADRYYFSPKGSKFRSMAGVRRYLAGEEGAGCTSVNLARESARRAGRRFPNKENEKKKEKNINPQYPVGTKITKMFHDEDLEKERPFLGKVVAYDGSEKLYSIEYEDGDAEDMEEGQLEECLVKEEGVGSEERDDAQNVTGRPVPVPCGPSWQSERRIEVFCSLHSRLEAAVSLDLTVPVAVAGRESIPAVQAFLGRMDLRPLEGTGKLGAVCATNAAGHRVSCLVFTRDDASCAPNPRVFDVARLTVGTRPQEKADAALCLRAFVALLRHNLPSAQIVIRAAVYDSVRSFFEGSGFKKGAMGLAGSPYCGVNCYTYHLVVSPPAAAASIGKGKS